MNCQSINILFNFAMVYCSLSFTLPSTNFPTVLANGAEQVVFSYLVFHDEDFLDGGALADDAFDLGPSVKAAHDGPDFGLVDGVNDAVIAQVCVQRHDGDVVLESSERGY